MFNDFFDRITPPISGGVDKIMIKSCYPVKYLTISWKACNRHLVLHIKPKVDDIAVLDFVIFAFKTHPSGLFCLLKRPVRL